jgi:hypothetical protein
MHGNQRRNHNNLFPKMKAPYRRLYNIYQPSYVMASPNESAATLDTARMSHQQLVTALST